MVNKEVIVEYIPDHLWRYVAPSNHKNGAILPSAFGLRDKTPPERYVSLQEGSGETIQEKLSSAIGIFNSKGWNMRATARLALVDVQSVYSTVNLPNKIIEFKDERRPHYGMYYVSNDETLIHEAKSLLQLCCTLYELNCLEGGDLKPTDDFLPAPGQAKLPQMQ